MLLLISFLYEIAEFSSIQDLSFLNSQTLIIFDIDET